MKNKHHKNETIFVKNKNKNMKNPETCAKSRDEYIIIRFKAVVRFCMEATIAFRTLFICIQCHTTAPMDCVQKVLLVGLV